MVPWCWITRFGTAKFFLKAGVQINEPVVERVFKYIFAISARVLSKFSNRHKHVLQRQLNKAERYFIGWQMTKLFSDVAESCLWFVQASLVRLACSSLIKFVPLPGTLIKSGIAMQLLHWINLDVVSCFKSL